jgi:hypothetical protein
MQVNAALQIYSGRELLTKWSISRTTSYAADCKGPCLPGALVIPNLTPASLVLDLVAPGQDYYGRQTQLGAGVRKIFKVGKYQFSGQADVFNILNNSYVKNQTRRSDRVWAIGSTCCSRACCGWRCRCVSRI